MFGDLLRDWRTTRGVSQLDLATTAGVSARHVSFMESGRARPSQDMVMRLSEALGLPLRERNALFVSAGFAPRYSENDLDSEAMVEVRAAIRTILVSHPYPALALDAGYDIVDRNDAAAQLLSLAGPIARPNLAEMVFRPSPLREAILNWPEVVAHMVHRLREGVRVRGPSERLTLLLGQAFREPGVREAASAGTAVRGKVVIPVRMRLGGTVTNWITTLTTFGAPQDAFVEELTIEQFHPFAG